MRARHTECKRGHDLTVEENVLTKKNGERQCRVCHRAANNAWRKKKYWEARSGPAFPPIPAGKADCEIETCDSPRRGNGSGGWSRYCAAHYWRLQTYGDVYEDVPINTFVPFVSLEQRREGLAG